MSNMKFSLPYHITVLCYDILSTVSLTSIKMHFSVVCISILSAVDKTDEDVPSVKNKLSYFEGWTHARISPSVI